MSHSLIAIRLTQLSYMTLLLALWLGVYWYGPDGLAAKVVLWTLVSSGLLLVGIGVFRAKRRSFQWLCFILLIYFLWVVQALFSGPTGQQAVLHEVVAAISITSCFIAAMFAARYS